MSRPWKVALLLLTLATTCIAQDAALGPGANPAIGWDPAIVRGTLDNGLSYVIARRANPPGRLEARLVVRGGASLETASERGLAHLCEHLAFRGSEHFAPSELRRYFDSLGITSAEHVNAFTSMDRILYRFPHPSSSSAEIERSLDVLSDFAGGVVLAQADVDAERAVVVEEWRRALGRRDRHERAWREAVFEGTDFATRGPIGSPDVVREASLEQIRSFYERSHRPDLMTAIVVGDIDPPAMESRLRARLGAKPRATDPVPALPAADIPADVRVRSWTEPGEAGTAVAISLVRRPRARQPGLIDSDSLRDQFAERVALRALGDRLKRLASTGDTPLLRTHSAADDAELGLRAITIQASVADGRAADAVGAIAALVAQLRSAGFDQSELDETRQPLQGALDRWRERDAARTSGSLADALADGALDRRPEPAPEAEVELLRASLADLTLDDVRRAWDDAVSASRCVILVACPAEGCVKDADIAAAWESSAAASGGALAPAPLGVTELIPNPPPPGRTLRRRELPRVEARQLTLSNGMRVLLRHGGSDEQRVRLLAIAPGGTFGLDPRRKAAAALLGPTIEMGGTRDHAPESISHYMKAQLECDPFQRTLRSGSGGQHLEATLQVVHAAFARPAFREAAFGKARELAIAAETRTASDAGSALERAFEQLALGDDVRLRRPSPDDLAAVTLDDLRVAHRELLGDPAEWTVILLGRLDFDTTAALAERWLASIPRPERPWPRPVPAAELARRAGFPSPAGPQVRELPLGPEGKASTVLGVGWNTRDDAMRMAGMDVANILTLRLRERLRESLGGTYAVVAEREEIPATGGPGFLVVRFDSSPEQRAMLSAAAREELSRLATSLPTEHELTTLRKAYPEVWRSSLADDDFWLDLLADAILRGDDPSTRMDTPAHFERLSAEGIRKASRRLLRPERIVEAWSTPKTAAASE